MKKTSKYLQRDRDLEIRLTPMIDVVFLLLVFFVWTASFHVAEQSLPATVSATGGNPDPQQVPEDVEFDDVVIRISYQRQAAWSLNGQPVSDLASMQRDLKSIAEIRNQTRVMIDPDPNVPFGEIIDVFDVAQTAGLSRIHFVASLSGKP